MTNIDIIIPIYNAFEDLQMCLQSIYKYTDLERNRLILINDNSPDERIRPFLDNQQRDGIIVIHNDVNKGFSNNINLGMEQSQENDVILLNSDTIVTEHWVEKMVECAYSAACIGTVTPLSNNATLCSVPKFCEENTLPKGMDVDEMAAIVEACSMRKYPRITVANGFCMLVKREVINAIGTFDAETFGRGYGEENDFCNRAEQVGYIHVMCDNTYIYHSGTKSFISKEKEAYIKEHERILNERYPVQMHKNAVHCRDNPNGWVGRNIEYHMDIWNGRKNVLYLLQSDFKEGADDNVGGTQLHVKNLTMELHKYMNIFVAARNKDCLQVTAYIQDKDYTFRFRIGEKTFFPELRNRELAKIFGMILTDFRIDLVHVHHTATTSLDIYYEAEKRNIPIIYTAHDFYYVCPSVKMLDNNGELCIGRKDLDCPNCLKQKCGLYQGNDYITIWRKRHEDVLNKCQMIIVPSESAKDILLSYYPSMESRVSVIEHGVNKPEILNIREEDICHTDNLKWEIEKIDKKGRCPLVVGKAYFKDEPEILYKSILRLTDETGRTIYMPTNFGSNPDVEHNENRFFAYLPNNILHSGKLNVELVLVKNGKFYMNKNSAVSLNDVVFSNKSKFKVAFIGGINEEKGGKLVAEIIKRGSDDVEWYVIGGIGEASLYNLKRDNLIKTGYYYQEDLTTHLKYHKIDAICILSKWPETFSYTLSEAITNHIPVIVTDIGALGQRTKRDGYGVAVTLEGKKTSEYVIEQIECWKDKGTDYQNVKKIAMQYKHTTISEMESQYERIYSSIIKNRERIIGASLNKEERETLYCAYDLDMSDSVGNQGLLDRINELESRLKSIDENLTIHYLWKLSNINFPFKEKMRNFILERKKTR